MTGVRVKIWFQNRRARDRREKREIKLSTSQINDDDDDDEREEELLEDDNEVIVS